MEYLFPSKWKESVRKPTMIFMKRMARFTWSFFCIVLWDCHGIAWDKRELGASRSLGAHQTMAAFVKGNENSVTMRVASELRRERE